MRRGSRNSRRSCPARRLTLTVGCVRLPMRGDDQERLRRLRQAGDDAGRDSRAASPRPAARTAAARPSRSRGRRRAAGRSRAVVGHGWRPQGALARAKRDASASASRLASAAAALARVAGNLRLARRRRKLRAEDSGASGRRNGHERTRNAHDGEGGVAARAVSDALLFHRLSRPRQSRLRRRPDEQGSRLLRRACSAARRAYSSSPISSSKCRATWRSTGSARGSGSPASCSPGG